MSANLRSSDGAHIRRERVSPPEHPPRMLDPHHRDSAASVFWSALGRRPQVAAAESKMPPRISSKPPRVPSYRLHKASGQAVVTLEGRDRYLGKFGSPESQSAYERLIVLFLAGGRKLPAHASWVGARRATTAGNFTVAELCDQFLQWAKQEYRLPDGSTSREVTNIRIALRPLLQLFFDLEASEFGPRSLVLYRQRLIDEQLSRKVINQRLGIVRRAFQWASREEKIPAHTYHGLLSVEGLKRGRCGARETPPVECVPIECIDTALPYMPPPVRAMVQLQLLTGARPGEMVILRPCDIDRSGRVWLYRPPAHKNAWRGHTRLIAIGPRGQAIVHEFLRPGYQERYLFSPTLSEIARHDRLRAVRRTPLWPSHVAAQERKRKSEPKRRPRDRYDVVTYARAIRRACARAGVPSWSPGRLRHNAATEARKRYGLEAASALLGHRLVETTQLYAEKNLARALEIAAEVG
jgi:integrase